MKMLKNNLKKNTADNFIQNNKNIELVETPNQNKTDFRKTLEWCVEKNILSISIFGISGESEDHFLGNYYTLSDFGDKISWKAFSL